MATTVMAMGSGVGMCTGASAATTTRLRLRKASNKASCSSSLKMVLTSQASSRAAAVMSDDGESERFSLSRRSALGTAVAAAGWTSAANFAVADETPELIEFTEDGEFVISHPKGWEVGIGSLDGGDFGPTRRAVSFYPPGDEEGSNLTVVASPLASDFMSLGSFGDEYTWAFGIVNGVDRSWNNPDGVSAKMVDYKKKSGMYIVDYTQTLPGQYDKHIYSAATIGNVRGAYNILYTVTATLPQSQWEEFGPVVKKAVDTFKPQNPGVLNPTR